MYADPTQPRARKLPATGMTVQTPTGPIGKVDRPARTGSGGGLVVKPMRPAIPAPGAAVQMAQPGGANLIDDSQFQPPSNGLPMGAQPAAGGGGGGVPQQITPQVPAPPAGGLPVSGGTAPGAAAAGTTMAPVGSTVTHQASDFSPAVAPPGGRQTTGSSPNTNLNPLQDRMRQQTMDWLNNPSPYDDALWQREVDRARATYDQQTNTGRQRLEAELAGRGVDFGTIGGREFSDFESNRARGFDDILTGFLSDRARGISDARAQAFNAGNSERNYYDNLRQTARGNAMEEWQAGDQSSQRWLAMAMNALGIGTDNAGQASQGYGQTGAMAGAGNAELMKYLAEYFGTRPQVAAPGTRPSQVSGR